MADRAALVTGGGSGIGKALARALAREGHDLVNLIEAHRSAYGRMDVLVNAAAAGSGRGTVAEVDPEVVERHSNVNLRSLFTTATCPRSSSRPRARRRSSSGWSPSAHSSRRRRVSSLVEL